MNINDIDRMIALIQANNWAIKNSNNPNVYASASILAETYNEIVQELEDAEVHLPKSLSQIEYSIYENSANVQELIQMIYNKDCLIHPILKLEREKILSQNCNSNETKKENLKDVVQDFANQAVNFGKNISNKVMKNLNLDALKDFSENIDTDILNADIENMIDNANDYLDQVKDELEDLIDELSDLEEEIEELEEEAEDNQDELSEYIGTSKKDGVYDSLLKALQKYSDRDYTGSADALLDIDSKKLTTKNMKSIYNDLTTKVYPNAATGLYSKGKNAYWSKDYKTAINYLKKAIKVRDTNSYAYSYLGQAYEASGDTKNAKKTYETLIKKFPGTSQARLAQTKIDAMGKKDAKSL